MRLRQEVNTSYINFLLKAEMGTQHWVFPSCCESLGSIPHRDELHTTKSWSRTEEHTLRILTTHTPKLLFAFGANLPHQRLSIVKVFCLICVSHSTREQKQQRGRNLLPLKPVVSTRFVIYPKQRVGSLPGKVQIPRSLGESPGQISFSFNRHERFHP